ncbi:MAG: NAD(P)H-quinone oxidoreductase [Trueperaceae bacterium]
MKAIAHDDGTLVWTEVPDPEPGDREALIRVRAAGVNRADLVQRAGGYPPPEGASQVLGLEVAGEVLEAPAASGWRPGDAVCALLSGGGYAERVAVPADLLMPVPNGMDAVQAAALPEAHLTSYLNLFQEARVQEGERALVHGGASGVGTAAIQQLREAGVRVATTSSARKTERCAELGADPALDRADRTWPERLQASWGGVDVILDMVGRAVADAGFELLATNGRLVWIAALSGRTVRVDVPTMMRKRLTLKGSTLRSRPLAEKVLLTRAFRERFGPHLDDGRIVPIVDRVIIVDRAEEAHEALRTNRTVGKVILRVP